MAKSPAPLERQEAALFMDMCILEALHDPRYALIFAIPNGGKRSMSEALRFKAEGVKAGVPDYLLPVPAGGEHGLFIELKRARGGEVSPEQKEWIAALNAQGYRAVVAKGAEVAIRVVKNYLAQPDAPPRLVSRLTAVPFERWGDD